MFTYFILMLVSTICGAFLSLLISYSLFVKKSEVVNNKQEIPHRLGIRLKVLEYDCSEFMSKLETQDEFIERTEEFILDKLEQELDQLRLELSQAISDIEIKSQL